MLQAVRSVLESSILLQPNGNTHGPSAETAHAVFEVFRIQKRPSQRCQASSSSSCFSCLCSDSRKGCRETIQHLCPAIHFAVNMTPAPGVNLGIVLSAFSRCPNINVSNFARFEGEMLELSACGEAIRANWERKILRTSGRSCLTFSGLKEYTLSIGVCISRSSR